MCGSGADRLKSSPQRCVKRRETAREVEVMRVRNREVI